MMALVKNTNSVVFEPEDLLAIASLRILSVDLINIGAAFFKKPDELSIKSTFGVANYALIVLSSQHGEKQ